MITFGCHRAILGAIGAAVLSGVSLAAAGQPVPRYSVYLAGPLGFSESGSKYLNDVIKPRLTSLGYLVVDPWQLTPAQDIAKVDALPEGKERRVAWEKLDQQIGERNAAALAASDIVVAVLDGPDVDSGTASEVGFAAALHKGIIGYRSDFRLSGDNEGVVVNLQVERFIRANRGTIVRSLSELPAALEGITKASVSAAQANNIESSSKSVPSRSEPAPIVEDSRDIQDVVDFFKKAFTIILALAFGEAFKQFVADKAVPDERHISWNRLPALLSFLLLLFPFFQGMYRYLFEVYQTPGRMPTPYGPTLLADGVVFTIESALFFVMSRALDPVQWRRFTWCVFFLMLVDGCWAAHASTYEHHTQSWMLLDAVSVVVLGIALLISRFSTRPRVIISVCGRKVPLVPTLFVVLYLARSGADYYFSWGHYFPNG